MDFIPSRERGTKARAFLRTSMTPPARKPPARAPRKPEGIPVKLA